MAGQTVPEPQTERSALAPEDEYVVNHCQMVKEAEQQLDGEQFYAAAQERARQLAYEQLYDVPASPKHELAAVEVVAVHLAAQIIAEGAKRVADDFGHEIGQMARHAASDNISYC